MSAVSNYYFRRNVAIGVTNVAEITFDYLKWLIWLNLPIMTAEALVQKDPGTFAAASLGIHLTSLAILEIAKNVLIPNARRDIMNEEPFG